MTTLTLAVNLTKEMSSGEDTKNLIINTVGEMGRYQIMLITIILWSRISSCLHQVIIMLQAPPVSNFTCSNPELSQCDPDCPGHEFDHSIWENTIIYEWDLVCDRHFYASMTQSVIMFGILVGSLIFGFLSDRYGRHKPVAVAITIQIITGIVTAFIPWFWMYTFLRFLICVATGGSILTLFCILIEFTSSKHRPLMAVLYALPCQISFSMMGVLGYYVRRWDYIQLIITAPSTLMISYWCLLPESPRWLLTMGKTEAVIKLLEKTARCNNLPTEHIREEVEKYVINNPQTEVKGGNILHLFRTKKMFVKTVVLSINWIVIGTDFFAVALYMGQISGNIFLNIGFAGLAQIPGVLTGVILLDRIGRKASLITGYLIISIPMLTTIVLFPNVAKFSVAILGCISMSGGALCFAIIFMYSGEIYPTLLRSAGLGINSMFAQYGSMLAPFILELKIVDTWIPPLLIGIFPIISGLLTLFFLPETKGVPLPNTIEDANKI